ncbi:NmrA domain-containing protein [Fusarium keratoplasticum]|uniref:NmrA domain-containing protein n=1 Tax=Fusarium keratoplasticum TaxID=1328300 RepID=A0ACC0QSQ9_9HYPO|nr:NmrA domain-containing protein [Fusarium keratoplasticum]KAI8663557.1 NmrA domain-containing protein [Fusarium keratoplasticum]
MPVVAVAGGSGDLGSLIVKALFERGKHEVYVLSRGPPADSPERVSPLTGKSYTAFIQNDYTSIDALTQDLDMRRVEVVICAFSLRNDNACNAQLQLIQAADKASSVRRFIPSEFNIDYDLGDAVPYSNKRFHLAGRRTLEKTSLEFSYIYPGMFMDYYGMPKFPTPLRPLCFFIDPVNQVAVLPDDGEAKMSMSLTTDVARYTALALDLEKWPRVMTTTASTVTLKSLVRLFEKSTGRPFNVEYQPVSKFLEHESMLLPENGAIAELFPQRFPGGLKQLRALIADLEASVALGAYDLDKIEGQLSLTEVFEGETSSPTRIEDLMKTAWGTD